MMAAKRKPKVVEPVVDDRTVTKASEHAELAREHGWDVIVQTNDKGGLTVTARKRDETLVLAYRPGGYLDNPLIVAIFPGRTVPLHNSGTWRRQVSLPEGKRPINARPKRNGVPKPVNPVVSIDSGDINGFAVADPAEAIPISRPSLPFPHDAPDEEIIDCIKGKTLFWRNNMAVKVVSVDLPGKPRLFRFGVTRTGRRFVSFPELVGVDKDGEVYGPERSVAIEDMLRVR